jgi:hypothetical protein
LSQQKEDIPKSESASPLSEPGGEIEQLVAGIRFGSVEITIHEGRVVQIERREKVRFEKEKKV